MTPKRTRRDAVTAAVADVGLNVNIGELVVENRPGRACVLTRAPRRSAYTRPTSLASVRSRVWVAAWALGVRSARTAQAVRLAPASRNCSTNFT